MTVICFVDIGNVLKMEEYKTRLIYIIFNDRSRVKYFCDDISTSFVCVQFSFLMQVHFAYKAYFMCLTLLLDYVDDRTISVPA